MAVLQANTFHWGTPSGVKFYEHAGVFVTLLRTRIFDLRVVGGAPHNTPSLTVFKLLFEHDEHSESFDPKFFQATIEDIRAQSPRYLTTEALNAQEKIEIKEWRREALERIQGASLDLFY